MVESFIPGSLEVSSNSNSLSEASEQDVVRVSESMQKAKQIGGQIRDDQRINTQLAQFLTYLFSVVQYDDIRTISVELFAKIDATLGMTTLAIYEMSSLYLPFYAGKANDLGLQNVFPHVHYEISLAEESYLNYIKQLYRHYPFFEQIDKDTLSVLVTQLLLYHRVIVIGEGESFETVQQRLRNAL